MKARVVVEMVCEGDELLGDEFDQEKCADSIVEQVYGRPENITTVQIVHAHGVIRGKGLALGWSQAGSGVDELNLCPRCNKQWQEAKNARARA